MHPILISASYDSTVRFWDLNRGSIIETINFKDSQINDMGISADRTVLALGCWQSLKLVDIYKRTPIVANDTLVRNVTSLYYLPESTRLITGGEDQRIRIWNTRGAQLQCEKIFELPNVVNSLCVHNNQTTIIAADNIGGIYQWDMRTGKHLQVAVKGLSFGEHIVSIASSGNGNTVAGATNQGRLFTWDVTAGTIEVKSDASSPTPNTPTPNNKLVGPLTLTQQTKIQAHNDFIIRVRFTPNSERLATTSADGSVCLWDPKNLESEKPLARLFDPHQPQGPGWIWDCAFTETLNSRYMITGSTDGILRLWDIPDEEVKMYFMGHNKPITAMAFRDVF